MSPTFRHLLAFFIQYGALGLFLLGLADDSFLFLPVGSDLLMVILVARNAAKFPLLHRPARPSDRPAASIYWTWFAAKAVRKVSPKIMRPNRLQYLKDKIEKHGLLC